MFLDSSIEDCLIHSGSNGIFLSTSKFDGPQSDSYGFAQAALQISMFPQFVVISVSVKMQTNSKLLTSPSNGYM